MRSARSAVLTLAFALGCSDQSAPEMLDDGSSGGSSETGAPPSFLPDRACPPDSVATQTNFGMPFVTTWCTSCHGVHVPASLRHGAPMEINLDTVDDVRARLAQVYIQAADDFIAMPPVGGPDGDERYLLGDWLACGAP